MDGVGESTLNPQMVEMLGAWWHGIPHMSCVFAQVKKYGIVIYVNMVGIQIVHMSYKQKYIYVHHIFTCMYMYTI